MSDINVLITGVGGGGVGEQIVKCLKMSHIDVTLIGCDMNRTSKGFMEVDKAYIVPKSSDSAYIKCIMEICKKNDVHIIFPGSEPELKVLSENRNIFESRDICIPLNPPSVINTCMNKNLTMQFLHDNGISTQKSWEISDTDTFDEIDVFPIVLKPSVGGGGSINTFIAQNREELETFGRYLLSLYSVFIAQEYIGDVEHEYTVGVMSDKNGNYVNVIAVKKSILFGLSNKVRVPNRTSRKELGEILAISSGISQGEIGKFPEVTEPCKMIAKSIGATAPLNIQGRLHNNAFCVFEINPRISGTSPLRAMVGYNEPEMLIKERIFHETLDVDFRYKEGIIARGLSETFIDNNYLMNEVVDMIETTKHIC